MTENEIQALYYEVHGAYYYDSEEFPLRPESVEGVELSGELRVEDLAEDARQPYLIFWQLVAHSEEALPWLNHSSTGS